MKRIPTEMMIVSNIFCIFAPSTGQLLPIPTNASAKLVQISWSTKGFVFF